MPLSLDEYRRKLIEIILIAGSQEEVKRFCFAAMDGLEFHEVNEYVIFSFVDKMISELAQFNPMKMDSQQWTNIRMGKIQFNRFKQQISATVT